MGIIKLNCTQLYGIWKWSMRITRILSYKIDSFNINLWFQILGFFLERYFYSKASVKGFETIVRIRLKKESLRWAAHRGAHRGARRGLRQMICEPSQSIQKQPSNLKRPSLFSICLTLINELGPLGSWIYLVRCSARPLYLKILSLLSPTIPKCSILTLEKCWNTMKSMWTYTS